MKRTFAAVLVAIMTILCIGGGGYSESDALNDGIEAQEIILDQLPEPEQESEEDMATGDKLVNLDDLKVAYDKQQEDTNSLKSALDATNADINKLIGNIQGSWKQGGMYVATGIEYSAVSTIITPFIKVNPGDTILIVNPDTSLVLNILEFASNTTTSSGVNERLAITYADSSLKYVTLGNSTNYIRLQMNTGDTLKGDDVLLYTKNSIVFEKIKQAEDLTNEIKSNALMLKSSYATALSQNDNLNNYTTPGNYYAPTSTIAASITNKPASVNLAFRLDVMQLTSSSRLIQRVISINKLEYIRFYIDETWGGWKQVTLLNEGWDIITSRGINVTADNYQTYFPTGSYSDVKYNVIMYINSNAPLTDGPDGDNTYGMTDVTRGRITGVLLVFAYNSPSNNSSGVSQLLVGYRNGKSPTLSYRTMVRIDGSESWTTWSKLSEDGYLHASNSVIYGGKLDKTFSNMNDMPNNSICQIDLNCDNSDAAHTLINNPAPGVSSVAMCCAFSTSTNHGKVQTVFARDGRVFWRYGYQNAVDDYRWTTWKRLIDDDEFKNSLTATDDTITFVAGGLFPEWEQGGMYAATGIEYISYEVIRTGFVNVSPGAVINIKKPSGYSVNILEFAENVDTSSGVNERLSIKYFPSGEQKTRITLGNSTNYIRLQVDQSDVSKGYDVLLQSETGSVYDAIKALKTEGEKLNNTINYLQQDIQLTDIEATWASGRVVRNSSTGLSELSASNAFAYSFVKVESDTDITIADGYLGFAWYTAYNEFGHAMGNISSGYNSGTVTYDYNPTFPYVIICVKRSDSGVITTEEAKNAVVISEFGKTIFATKERVEQIAESTGISPSITPTKGQVCYLGDTKSNGGYICNAIAYDDGVIIAARSNGTVVRIGYSGTEETLLTLTGSTFDWRCLWMDSKENVYASPHASWGEMNVADRGLYRLEKGGSSFTKVLSLYNTSSQVTTETQNNDDTIWTMCEDADGNLYAGVYAHTVRANPAIYKSTDGGLTWTYVFNFNTAGLTTNGKHIHTIIFSKWQNALYCIVGEENTIFKSTDGSETWTDLHVTLTVKGSSMLATEYGIFIGSDGAYNCDIDILYPDDTTHKKVYRGWANTVFAIRQSDVTGILYAFTKIDSSVNSLAYYPPVAALTDPAEITAWLASDAATHKADWQAYYDSVIDIYPDDAIRPQHYGIIASRDGGMTWSPVKAFSCASTAANGCWTTGFFINGECLTGRMENGTSVKPVIISEGKHKYVSGGCDLDGEIFVRTNSNSIVQPITSN